MDLPDEMIIKILNNINNINILYSFIGVNKRFDKLVRDRVYTRSIQLTEKNPATNQYCSLPDSIIDRYCLNILPETHQYIEYLILEPLSMECILLSNVYPRLYKLELTKIDEDFVFRYFTEESPLGNIFNNITHLILTIDRKRFTPSISIEFSKKLLSRIFHTFINLHELDFNQNNIEHRPVISLDDLSSKTCYSSSLVNLVIILQKFNDCVCLFDGRFPQLHKLCVVVGNINISSLSIENWTTVLNLKYFSFTSYSEINAYDNCILPLIRQMINLEKLTLYINVDHKSTFIDDTHLFTTP